MQEEVHAASRRPIRISYYRLLRKKGSLESARMPVEEFSRTAGERLTPRPLAKEWCHRANANVLLGLQSGDRGQERSLC